MNSKTNIYKSRVRSISPFHFLLVALALGYVYLLYRSAGVLKTAHQSKELLFVINLTIAIPEIAIWSVALISAQKVKQYALTIKASKDGEAFVYLADALLLVAIYIILICTATSIISLFNKTSNLDTIILLENYFPLFIGLASSVLLLFSGREFTKIVPIKVPRFKIILMAILFIAVTALFAWHFYSINPNNMPKNGTPKFVSPRGTLMLAYVLPQIVIWAIGLLACFGIANYSFFVRGAIYKKLLSNLYKGVLIVFVCIFLAQLFILSSVSLNKFSFGLILIYGLLILGGLGFTLIYKGASLLTKLEKI